MNLFIAGAVGAALGAFVVWVLVARRRVRIAMLDELERDGRYSMRRFLGHAIPTFSPMIQQLSPQFCLVYRQAADAESYGLDQVCGVGYGKALEFLIKDYAKKEKPSDAGTIEKGTLATVIRDHVLDPAIRDSVDLARWLRNDETHYIRKYVGKDLQDLKRLVALAIALIENAVQRRSLEQAAGREKTAFAGSGNAPSTT